MTQLLLFCPISPKLTLFAAVVSGFPEKPFAMPKLVRILTFTLLALALPACMHAYRLAAQSVPPSAASSGHSVAPQPDDDPDGSSDDSEAKLKATILLATISFTDNDHLTVRANAFQSDPPTFQSAELKKDLQDAVGCSLTDSARVKVTSVYYLGSCTLPRSGTRLLRQGRISTAPLKRYCEQHNLEILTVQFEFADTAFLETVPPASASAPINGFNISDKQKKRLAEYFQRHPVYRWNRSQFIPASIDYRFGYDPSKLQRGAVALVLILVAPVVLVFWLGRKALSADVADKSVIWFSYMRTLSWVLNGYLLFWWAALDFFQVQAVLRFLAAGFSYASILSHPAATQLLGWVPPSLIWLFCQQLSHPVQEKLRGLSWTKRELTLQAFYSVLAGLVPFALFLTGISLISSSSSSSAVWFIAAFIVRVFAARALLKLTGMQPHALTTGPLRDACATCKWKSSRPSICPVIFKAAVEMTTAQSENRVGSPHGPEHTRSFEAGADYRLAAGFDHTRANKQMLAPNLGISHALRIPRKVVRFRAHLLGNVGIVSIDGT